MGDVCEKGVMFVQHCSSFPTFPCDLECHGRALWKQPQASVQGWVGSTGGGRGSIEPPG